MTSMYTKVFMKFGPFKLEHTNKISQSRKVIGIEKCFLVNVLTLSKLQIPEVIF